MGDNRNAVAPWGRGRKARGDKNDIVGAGRNRVAVGMADRGQPWAGRRNPIGTRDLTGRR